MPIMKYFTRDKMIQNGIGYSYISAHFTSPPPFRSIQQRPSQKEREGEFRIAVSGGTIKSQHCLDNLILTLYRNTEGLKPFSDRHSKKHSDFCALCRMGDWGIAGSERESRQSVSRGSVALDSNCLQVMVNVKVTQWLFEVGGGKPILSGKFLRKRPCSWLGPINTTRSKWVTLIGSKIQKLKATSGRQLEATGDGFFKLRGMEREKKASAMVSESLKKKLMPLFGNDVVWRVA